MTKRILRPKEAQRRLGIGHTNFNDNFVRTGRVRLVRLGPRSVGVIEEELDALIDEIAAARDRGEKALLQTPQAVTADPDYDNWPGHDVRVFAGEVDFQHGKADAVLVELTGTETPPSKPPTPPATSTEPTEPNTGTEAPRRGARRESSDIVPVANRSRRGHSR